MKKLLVLISLMILIGVIGVYAECTDSDGGKDYYVKGSINVTINGTSEVFYDICGLNINNIDYPNKLEEKYCDGGRYADTKFDCPNGCSDGACISPEQTVICKDSDNGLNYYEKGKCVSGKINSAEEELFDACISNGPYAGEIREAYCNEENKCSFQPFKCENGCKEGACLGGRVDIDEIEKKGFKHAYFQCYDGSESSSIRREACKSAEYWHKFAKRFCESHCKKTGEVEKCGVNTFSIGDECYLGEGLCLEGESVNGCCERWSQENNIIKPACVGEWDIEENKCSWSCKEEEEFDKKEGFLVCKNSCPLNEKCYPFGYRKAGEYCSDEGKFVEQKEESCDNNFECKSNVCVDGKCVSGNLIQKIIEWFRRLFGLS